MSHDTNTTILELFKENFEAACVEENWDLARAVIADLKNEGFSRQASALEDELVRIQNEEKEEDYE